MPLFAQVKAPGRLRRFSIFCIILLSVSIFTLAQVNLKFRLLNGYFLSEDAPVNKGKPTLFVFEQAETFEQVFQPATNLKRRPDRPNFTNEMIVGIAIPPTNAPPQLSVSKVFVQDSTLTIRYIRLADTALVRTPQPFVSHPMLLVAIPKQTVLKTRLVENGKVVQTLKRRDVEQ